MVTSRMFELSLGCIFVSVRQTCTHLMASFPGQPGTRKVKLIWILMKQAIMGWQWYHLDHMQIICTSVQTDNHAITSSLNFFTGWMRFLTPNQWCQSTEGKPFHKY